jgi:hypothetical protein
MAPLAGPPKSDAILSYDDTPLTSQVNPRRLERTSATFPLATISASILVR